MKILIGVAALVAAGLGLFFGMSYRLDVGIGPANPLGDFAKIEKELVAKGLRKTDPQPGEAQSLFAECLVMGEGMIATAFVDMVPGLRHQTIVVRSAQGRVIGVCCRFRSGAQSFSKTGTRCENVAALVWTSIAGKEPAFVKTTEGGSDARECLVAKFQKGPVEGFWKKEGGSAVISMVPQDIADTVTFVAR